MLKPQKKFMERAIREAKAAKRMGDYAIGAVMARGNRIISSASNRSIRDENPIGHAETLAILQASKVLKRRHMSDCVLYTTHEPCPMCSSAAVWAKLNGIVYGSRVSDMNDHGKNHGNQRYSWRTIKISSKEIVKKSPGKIEIVKDFMRDECKKLFHS